MFPQNHRILTPVVLALTLLSACAPFRNERLSGEYTVRATYGSNMVLQAEKPVRITGTAAPGKGVLVTLNEKIVFAEAGGDGSWTALLPAMKPGGPYSLTIEGADRKTVFENVLFGEVWLCSGQSNMAMAVKSCLNPEKEIALAADYPQIRLFKEARKTAFHGPQSQPEGSGWEICSPATVENFSAIAYFFGRKLQTDLRVPIGLIDSAWGGTRIQAWIGRNAFESAGLTQDLAILRDARSQTPQTLEQRHREFLRRFRKWESDFLNSNPAATRAAAEWKKESIPETGWTALDLPGEVDANPPFFDLDGVFWIRKTIQLSPEFAQSDLTLKIDRIDDCDEAWFNGVRIGGTGTETPSYWSTPRNYRIPAGTARAGANTLAIRIIDHASAAAVGELRLVSSTGKTMDLAGRWLAKLEFAVDSRKIPPRPQPPFPYNQNTPSVLYNAMIAPWTTYPIRGILWYQGEANASDPKAYMTYFPLLIQSWRKAWNEPAMPFLFVQLAAFERHQPQKKLPPDFFRNRRPSARGGWAPLREVQEAALLLPNTGMATAIDIGDPNDIHPKNKQEVARRLALEAERIAYGREPVRAAGKGEPASAEKVMTRGPIYEKMKIEGGRIRLFFRFVGRGLMAKGGSLKQFSIAGNDGKFVWANAVIDGKTVVVWSPEVPSPRAVRYAWDSYPEGANLCNLDGLPAGSFRTDKPDYLIK